MRLHRFFGNFDFGSGKISVSDAELVGQWRDVLRLIAGDEIILCDGNGNDARARIISLGKHSAEVEILGVSKNKNEPERAVTLYLSILKGEHFELAAEKATELGVLRIVPIIAERTVKSNLRTDRIRKIIREAAEQSGRGVVPELGESVPLKGALLEAAKNNDANFFFHLGGEEIKTFAGEKFGSAGIFIGPEGGWTESEVALAKQSECTITSLGKLILRAETAAIAATYSVLNI